MATHPIEQVLRGLNAESVRYLVVGGVAVVLHGHLRTTADLDLVLALSPDNIRRAIMALDGLGFRPRAPVPAMDFADAEKRATWISEKGLTVFSLWSEQVAGVEVDLFVEEPFDFEQAYARAVRVTLVSCLINSLQYRGRRCARSTRREEGEYWCIFNRRATPWVGMQRRTNINRMDETGH